MGFQSASSADPRYSMGAYDPMDQRFQDQGDFTMQQGYNPLFSPFAGAGGRDDKQAAMFRAASMGGMMTPGGSSGGLPPVHGGPGTGMRGPAPQYGGGGGSGSGGAAGAAGGAASGGLNGIAAMLAQIFAGNNGSIPAFTGQGATSGTVDGVGSFSDSGNMQAYLGQLGLLGQNNASQSQAASSMFGSQAQKDSALGTAQIGADASRYNADQGLSGIGKQTDAQRYGFDQGLAGTKYQSDEALKAAQIAADTGRYTADAANLPAKLANDLMINQKIPLFQAMMNRGGSGGSMGSMLAAMGGGGAAGGPTVRRATV